MVGAVTELAPRAELGIIMFYLSFMAVLTLVSNLLTDIMYAVVDPRVRIS